ncbi:MAG TPA: protein-disulfide reductase DsbD domain-containing protein [Oligoflexus sp.]|uniref:protein-disulfide reductase DsbD family protein n=1 Tax=Oligoflexus sp. TaxID=1971216 RepID=UPI002D2CFD54|nr:protein-disulfide reductase DsbD domain-containing protein [Oligoflexus sp.]HYX38990.1 protein-disulfide reductase DsbD domain-containing protein [Oligoflexus sp.]
MKPVLWISFILIVFSWKAQGFTGATATYRGAHVQVQVLSSELSLRPGQTQTFAIRFVLDPHWHVYWQNAGDSGQAPEMQWSKPSGLKASEFSWPMPQRIQVGPFYNFGYEGEVLLPFSVTVPNSVTGTSLDLEVLVKWLVCEEECIPGQNLFSWSMPIQQGKKPEPGPWQAVIQKSLEQAPQGHVRAELATPSTPDTLSFKLDPANLPAELRLVEFFPLQGTGMQNVPPLLTDLTLSVPKSSVPSSQPLSGLVIFEDKAGQRLSYVMSLAEPTASPENLWTLLCLAFLGGLILNIMPCVLPVLAIKILSLVRETGENQRKVRLGSLAYGLGVVLSFLGLAGLLLVIKAGGEAVGWGFQLQSPAFIAALALLFFLMALNFLDLIQPWNAFTRLGNVGTSRTGSGGQFLSGVLAVIVASPCTGPFMGIAVGSALTRSPLESCLIFLFIGLGFLSPFIALAWIPGSRRLLPKPGMWMETFRQLMAFPLLLTILWLLWVLEKQSGMDGVLWVLTAFVGLGFCAWLWLQVKSKAPRAWMVMTFIILLLCGVAIQQQKHAVATSSGQVGKVVADVWQPFSADSLVSARQKGPVFIDFTAAWCVTCQVNKTLVLNRDDVQKAFKDQGIQLMRADWTDYNPEITRMLASLGRQGVPVYVLYRDATSEPVLLPEVLTPDLLFKEIGRVSSNAIKE